MATQGRTEYTWQITCTPVGGVGEPVIFKSGSLHKTRPSAWTLEQREDVASARFEITFPDAGQFFNTWNEYNPLAPGSLVVLTVDGHTRYTGKVFGHTFRYNANVRSVTIVCQDKMGTLKDACVKVDLTRKRIRSGRFNLTRNVTHNYMFEAITDDATPLYLRPWHPEFIVPVWVLIDDKYLRVAYSEYEILYDIGAVYFRNNTVKLIGEDAADVHDLADIEDDLYADFVYYDADDDSTMISNLLREAFETAENIGGMAWTEGVDYDIDDETTADILSGMKWDTNQGDGDAQSFLQNLYDNDKIGLTPSYWIRDFNGNGKVNARLVAQDNDNAIDIDLILDAEFPSPLQNIYTRAIIVNNEPTRENLTRDSATFEDTFGLAGYSETPGMPDEVDLKVGYLADDTVKTSWGYFKIGHKGEYPLDYDLPIDQELFRVDLGEKKLIDIIHCASRYTFNGGDDAQPILHDEASTEEAYNGLYQIHENQRFTVEYNLDSDATPDEDEWYPIHPDLYLAEVDPLDGEGAWLTVNGIDIEARHLRTIINNPLFGKVSESNWTNEAFRIILFWMSEFQVFGGGRVLSGDGETQPEVVFTADPDDEYRCLCNLSGESVDMYRPLLLQITEAMGLKYRTLVVNNDDVWEFLTKDSAEVATPDDCDDVSVGYKYLVTLLDSYSKENEWRVAIYPRPDLVIGSTVYSSKLDPDKKFLVHQSVLNMSNSKLQQTVVLSDHETTSGGAEGDGC